MGKKKIVNKLKRKATPYVRTSMSRLKLKYHRQKVIKQANIKLQAQLKRMRYQNRLTVRAEQKQYQDTISSMVIGVKRVKFDEIKIQIYQYEKWIEQKEQQSQQYQVQQQEEEKSQQSEHSEESKDEQEWYESKKARLKALAQKAKNKLQK